jgi:hypothetical protein
MKGLLPIFGLFILAFGLPACRLECFGDGPITWDSVTLIPNVFQTVAGGNPIGMSLMDEFIVEVFLRNLPGVSSHLWGKSKLQAILCRSRINHPIPLTRQRTSKSLFTLMVMDRTRNPM